MENHMRNIFLAGVAALALATAPAIAQDTYNDTNSAGAQQPMANAPAPRSAAEANAQAQPAPPTRDVITNETTGASTVVTTYPGNLTPPSAASLDKTYPVCNAHRQDNCQNPGEGGAPGHSRALHYWPGQPASEGGH
jgi:hypothetical protein